MPKIREHKQPPAQALVVSPWQTKREPQEAHLAAAACEPCMYSVVTADLLACQPAAAINNHQEQVVQQQKQQQQQQSHAHTTDMQQQQQPAPFASATASSWHKRRRAPSSTHGTQPAAAAAAPPSPTTTAAQQQQAATRASSDSASITTATTTTNNNTPRSAGAPPRVNGHGSPQQHGQQAAGDVAAMPQDQQDQQAEEELADAGMLASGDSHSDSAATTLQGVAQLVLLPNGAITGRFMAADSSSTGSRSRLCLQLQGKQVLGLHSCYRDPEWALLQLTIIGRGGLGGGSSSDSSGGSDHGAGAAAAAGEDAADAAIAEEAAAAAAAGGGGGSSAGAREAEATAWVQRTGGDLATLLPADLDDEDTEAAVRAENLGELPANVAVHLSPHTLLAGQAAARVLCGAWPELARLPDVLVNLGDMSIGSLPAGFLRAA